MTENKLIDDHEARTILNDAAAARRSAIPLVADGQDHAATVLPIERLLKSGNSVRGA
jgi:hypothetical protein